MFSIILTLWLSAVAFTQDFQTQLYSPYGEEVTVSFRAVYLTRFQTLDEMIKSLPADRSNYDHYSIEPTLKYLFGPLTQRSWGGIKKTLSLDVDWARARETERGVEIPYSYKGQWLLDVRFLDQRETLLPIPFNTSLLLSPRWQKCTDREHNSESFYWYYWEPGRSGCDHVEGQHFQNTDLKLSASTQETTQSAPEYGRLIRQREGAPTLSMTFGFGYYEEPDRPAPDTDKDIGAREYQKFVRELRRLLPPQYSHKEIMRTDYPNSWGDNNLVGHRFEFKKDGVIFNIKVVMNAGVDQMLLFARSYAEEHDGYFAWVGHSRVGSGFDARTFESLLQNHPQQYSISSDYQLIYWGGCNSYSYYTEPFFAMKAAVNPADPMGTRALDIIANGLPSYFGLNSANALIHLKALLRWREAPSYQSILTEMEKQASYLGTHVLVVVLGDEDNKANQSP